MPISSSPVPASDMMDISPIPRKGLFTPTTGPASPTPRDGHYEQDDQDDEMMMESPIAMSRHHSTTDLSKNLHEYVGQSRINRDIRMV